MVTNYSNNLRRKGYLRDKAIIEEVTKRKCLNTDQIYHLFFSNIPTGLKKCQQRLKILADPQKGRLRRFQTTKDDPYIYYGVGDKKKAQFEHQIIVNWIYVWFVKTLRSWEKLYRFDGPQDYGILKNDAFVVKRNTWTGEHRFYFVEAEVNNHSPFNKVRLYNRLYEEGNYLDWWWVRLANGFPDVLVVCENQKRLAEAMRSVERENKHGLGFVVKSLEELKGEIKGEMRNMVSTQK